MNLKTYQAYTMAQALSAVKDDLGPEAVILNTRSFKRGGVLGIGRKTIIEVTATAAGSGAAVLKAPAQKPIAATAMPAKKAYAKTAGLGGVPQATANGAKAAGQTPRDQDRQRAQLLAQILLEQQKRNSAAAAIPRGPRTQGNSDPRGAGLQNGSSAISPPRRFSMPAQPQVVVMNETIDTFNGNEQLNATGGSRQASARGSLPQDEVGPARRFVLQPSEIANDDAKPVKETVATGAESPVSVAQQPVVVVRNQPQKRNGPVTIFPDTSNDRAPAAAPSASMDVDVHAMQDELQAIKSMVGQVLQRQTTSKAAGGQSGAASSMPQHLFDMYLKLVSHDLSDELADQIVNDVRDELNGMELEDPTIVREAVLRHLADFIPVAQQPVDEHRHDGRPLTIALVGPTGVGKTTTLAKLAASFKLRHKKKVGLITADTYRIAAVDQLRTYANIIGIPLQVVLSPEDMANAVRALGGCDVILIDTAGRSQNDVHRIDELKAYIAAADPHEVHMVLSSTAGEKVLLREAEAFSSIGVQKIVLTKLDEAVSFGMLVNVVRKLGKQLSFFTTGQEVPDHIEVSRPDRLAKLVLEGAVHS
ncbi:MAG TPA: flagellar biosynthesis protein FlhF [Phycisphaerales bacterium]|nr:flagellar biosynthesis protein FlhF [Phycisphaerales bacterium]